MKDLIERLEKATGPDRELDNLIWFWLGQPLPDDCADCPARYTASLDAALTLVPESCSWACGYSRLVPHNAKVYVEGTGAFIGECDSNRAIALCIAALRARMAAERDLT